MWTPGVVAGGGGRGAGNIRIQHESIGENLHTTCTLYNYTRHAHFTITQDRHTLQLHKTCTVHTLQLHKTCMLYNYTRHAHFTITQDMHTLQYTRHAQFTITQDMHTSHLQ